MAAVCVHACVGGEGVWVHGGVLFMTRVSLLWGIWTTFFVKLSEVCREKIIQYESKQIVIWLG